MGNARQKKPDIEEHVAEVPFGAGKLRSSKWLFDKIAMNHSLVFNNEPGSTHASNDEEAVRLHFGLKGDYSFSYPQIGKSFDLKAGHHNMMYSKGIDLHIHSSSAVIETFGINFPKEIFINLTDGTNDALSRFAEQILEGKNVILSDQWQIVDMPLQNIINEALNCRFTGRLKKLFLLSKAIELLVYQAEKFNLKASSGKQIIKTKTDKEKILAARDLVLQNIISPPSLSEISKEIGLNEYKLKKGFKETFKTTVFGYLSEHRLDMARKLLLDTSQTAGEIAFELGYASPQHFNNAFKKKFGAAPNSFRQ